MPTSDHHIYSGGAIGIDEYAEQCAKTHGMHMHVIIPPQHHRSRFITPLTQQELDEAEPHLKLAAERSGKHLFNSNTFFHHLLARNYHIVKNVQIVYAFGYFQESSTSSRETIYLLRYTSARETTFKEQRIQGGTGWTVQLALDKKKTCLFLQHS